MNEQMKEVMEKLYEMDEETFEAFCKNFPDEQVKIFKRIPPFLPTYWHLFTNEDFSYEFKTDADGYVKKLRECNPHDHSGEVLPIRLYDERHPSEEEE